MTAADLIARADEIDRRLGPIPGDTADAIADQLRKAAKDYERLLSTFSELQAAAQKVVDETDSIHDSSTEWRRYRAPYGAITELRQLLAKQYGLRG
jgi:hypothetical protein